MVHTLSFKNLPFTPVDKQVIYFEEAHNNIAVGGFYLCATPSFLS